MNALCVIGILCCLIDPGYQILKSSVDSTRSHSCSERDLLPTPVTIGRALRGSCEARGGVMLLQREMRIILAFDLITYLEYDR